MRRTLIALAFAAPLTAFAANPTIDKITATPSQAKVGEPVTITIEASDAEGGMCGLDLNWGDGNRMPPKKVGGNHKNFPLTLQHTYTKPGTYEIKADGKRAETYLGCMGKAKLMLTVEGAAAAAGGKPACPADWKLKGKAAKDGSFTCAPSKKGAAKPEKELTCPAGTSYFFSSKSLGCEKSQ
ncbi:MAG: PKD domain-containing protein [Betaproteobacteria bacterium]|jgi:hypothetical protein|uniref:PKD domain-containing protein n=1 Tax=Candidatus Proximibacter danicus TaxID=2954365 RepID=A0A9D7K040_9PROT|nr:PKD domain-containing protein [Candidatus Proximibacter danicus]MBK9445067.1 PKD domain-containing protein [Betaproteobacteria bacterium]